VKRAQEHSITSQGTSAWQRLCSTTLQIKLHQHNVQDTTLNQWSNAVSRTRVSDFTPEVRDAMIAAYDRQRQEQEVVAAKQAATSLDKARKLAEAHQDAAAVRAALERGDMQCIQKMTANHVVAAANLILVPAEKLRTKGAAVEALRALCAVSDPQHDVGSAEPWVLGIGRPGHFDAQIPRDNENWVDLF
jgi:hypothetical protein